jgi:hypothetical protein
MRRLAAGAAAAGILSAGIVLGTSVPWVAEPGGDALIRLSWRAVGERIEECREPSAEEQARLPAHMRQSRICERRLAPFHLVVHLDGRPALDEVVAASGARDDRPTYVFRELRVPPGDHRVELRFEVDRPAGRTGAAGQPPLLLDERVVLVPRQILLVTRAGDADGGGLRMIGGG